MTRSPESSIYCTVLTISLVMALVDNKKPDFCAKPDLVWNGIKWKVRFGTEYAKHGKFE